MNAEEELAAARREYEAAQEWLAPTVIREETDDD